MGLHFIQSQAGSSALRNILLLLLLWVQSSAQQKDPVNDFCRRFGHQQAIIDNKLYLDGGLVNWNPISQNPSNYTNTFLSYNDLSAVSSAGEPPLYANLSKNATIPNVVGGILWADNINKRFYLFGGEYYQTPATPYKLLAYDAIYNQWDSFGVPSTPIDSVSYGAGIGVSERGEGYYYGGWMNNATTPGYTSAPTATSNLVKYDMNTNLWSKADGPDHTPRAEGVMVYLPASDRGLLVYFGGITQPYGNATIEGSPMSLIHIYDIASNKWYMQNATGDVPEMRRKFCAGATWAQDQSSYNIYLYGGSGMPPNTTGFDDVYILSLPSFTWLKWYPTTPGIGAPHNSLTCSIINGAQMLVIGGTFPISDACDAPAVYGTHSLDLGKQNPDNAMWYAYRSNITSYVVPEELIAKIGGNSLGKATVTAPSAWSNRDLPVYFTRKANIAVRTATRAVSTAVPSATTSPTPSSSSSSSSSLSTGAIAGIAVGGAAILALLVLGVVCLGRHRKRRQATDPNQPPYHYHPTSPYPPQYPQQYPQAPHPHGELAASPVEIGGYAVQQPSSQIHEVSMEPKYDSAAAHAMRHNASQSQENIHNNMYGIWPPQTGTPPPMPHQYGSPPAMYPQQYPTSASPGTVSSQSPHPSTHASLSQYSPAPATLTPVKTEGTGGGQGHYGYR